MMRSLILIIDETGDKKQGRTTDYVKRQYIGLNDIDPTTILGVSGEALTMNQIALRIKDMVALIKLEGL